MKGLYVTILAGGVGRRMNSEVPKVLHLVKGESMIVRLIRQVQLLNPDKIIVVVGKFYVMIREEIEKYIEYPITYAIQEKPLGTGDAVKSTLHLFNTEEEITNIILNGDVPMLQFETIQQIYNEYLKRGSKLQITTIELENPTGNGRIMINSDGLFEEIKEEKDCTEEQKMIKIVNCGIYICDSSILLKYIPLIESNNAQNEFYLTDLVKIYIDKSHQPIHQYRLEKEKEKEIYNVNTKEQLKFLQAS